MAHDIDTSKGRAAMAFTGETPWHGLGQRLTETATVEQWTVEAGMDWEALSAPVQFVDQHGTLVKMPEKQVIYRSDTGDALSVMGGRYRIVQPREVMEFFRDLTEQGGWKLHTAGVLDGGRKMWALARNHTEGDVVPGDRVKGNLLLATSLDGTMPTVAAMTAIRVVCANTLRMALQGSFVTAGNGRLGKVRDGQRALKVSHRSQFDAAAVKAEMGVARETFDDFMSKARAMADMPCHVEEARAILRRIFGEPHQSRGATPTSDGVSMLTVNRNLASVEPQSELARLLAKDSGGRVTEQKSVARALALFSGEGRGANAEGVAGTRWGLFNAITEHVDHEQGRTRDARLQSAWFGRGDGFKQAALSELLKA